MPTSSRLSSFEAADRVARAINASFVSGEVCDRQGFPANVVDVLDSIAVAIHHLAEAHERSMNNIANALLNMSDDRD